MYKFVETYILSRIYYRDLQVNKINDSFTLLEKGDVG